MTNWPVAAAADTFVFAPGDGNDEVINNGGFEITDKIDLSAFSSIASLDDLQDDIDTRTGNTEIVLSSGDEVTLIGFITDLTADNFIFHDRPVNGTGSSNVLEGDLYNNTMNGMGGDDRMYGEKGRDTMNGGSGDDEMYGGEDKDILNGGEGDDLMDGGPGADTFVFEPDHGNDHIMDFTPDVDDIDLTELSVTYSQLTDNNDSNGEITQVGDDTKIDLPDGGQIILLGISPSDLTLGDFI